MANSYFEVDVGINVGNINITAANGAISAGAISATGNITTTGNITLNSTSYNMSANSVVQKSYVDNIAVVFGI